MAYTKPAVLVYQELLQAGGAANTSPDLPACIIGVANNVINIDIGDPISAAKSLAATLYTIDSSEGGVAADWAISVNQDSAFPGQIIEDASVEVTMVNPLVSTYNVSNAVSAGTVTVDSTTVVNTIGGTSAAGSNRATDSLPWISSKNHVSVGDTVEVYSAGSLVGVTFVSSVVVDANTPTTDIITIADTSLAGDEITVYTKLNTSVATPDWVDTSDVLMVGTTSAETRPQGTEIADAYKYYVESEVKGYGSPISVHIGYKATRADLDGKIGVATDVTDSENQLGTGHPVDNPLAFGVELALANSGGAPVYFIGIESDTLADHTKAASLASGQQLYWICPLTTDSASQAMYKSHVNAMSLPTSGNWRVALFNQAIPEELYILGRPDGGSDENGFAANLVPATVNGTTILVEEGNVGNTNAGHTVYVYDGSDSNVAPEELTVSDASGSIISTTTPATFSGQAYIYVSDSELTPQDEAQMIADQSATYSDRRVLNFPGEVMAIVNGVDTNVAGYFLMAAVAGMGSGFPAQQGFTNITVAGITNLRHANFYFSEDQLNLMAEKGTFLFTQESQGTTPYCRHGLTTDVSVLEYREILKVKNWDYLSYYFKSVLAPFIGTWNITPGTLQTIRQTITSAAEQLLGRKLPKIGPPLLSYSIARLEQNANSKDAIDIDLQVAIVSPNNYTNLYLQI